MEEWTIQGFITLGATVAMIVIAGVALWFNYKNSNNQTKINSANLVHTLREPWRSNEEFKKIFDPDPTKETIRLYLTQMEIVAIYWEDGTLTDNHVKERFGYDLKTILDNEDIKTSLHARNDAEPFVYSKLVLLMKKLSDWKIG